MRYTTILAALIVCLLIGMAVPVSAYDWEESFTYSAQDSHWTIVNSNPQTIMYAVKTIKFIDIDTYPFITWIVFSSQYDGTYYWNTRFITDDYIASGSAPCTFTIGEETIGTGTISYNVNYNPNGTPKSIIVKIEFDEWDIGSHVGAKYVTVNYDAGAVNGLNPWYADPPIGALSQADNRNLAFNLAGSSGNFNRFGTYIIQSKREWRTDIGADFVSGHAVVDITRVFSGTAYNSLVNLTGSSSGIAYLNDYSNNDLNDVIVLESPFYVTITDPYGNVYTRTIPDTPTSTTSTYSLWANPTPSLGVPSTYTLQSASGNYDVGYIAWYSSDVLTQPDVYKNVTGTWYQLNHDTGAFDIATDLEDARDFIRTFNSVGTQWVECRIYTSDYTIIQTVRENYVIGNAASYVNFYITIYDITTGSTSKTLIPGASLNIYDITNASWYNTTSTTGYTVYNARKDHLYKIYASKSGFGALSGYVQTIADQNKNIYFAMRPDYTPGANKTLVQFYVSDAVTKLGIPQASVWGAQTGNGSVTFAGSTNNQGAYWLEVDSNKEYIYTAAKTGYYSSVDKFNVSSQTTINVELVPEGVVPTYTLTPVPTNPTAPPTTFPLPTGGAPVSDNARSGIREAFAQGAEILPDLFLMALIIFFIAMVNSLGSGGRRR